ncbi:MAG: ring-cleaving dioxygenase [Acidobacteriota bacterium]
MTASPNPSPFAAAPTFPGIHHVTMLAGDAQRNLDFYVGTLGLRLVKRTVNFDDPTTYHLYYGDALGRPGTLLTFFPWPGARRAQRGSGAIESVALAVPPSSLDAWRTRLDDAGVAHTAIERFGTDGLAFDDPDGLRLELVATGDDDADPAIQRVDTVTLRLREAAPSAAFLRDVLGFHDATRDGLHQRLAFADGGPSARVDLIEDPTTARARGGAGGVHHLAFRVTDDAAQGAWQDRIAQAGHHVTAVQDRSYFRSIYFREPGGVLYEIATDPPGFTRDEPAASLGAGLQLPAWFEGRRAEIEAALPPLRDAASPPITTTHPEVQP